MTIVNLKYSSLKKPNLLLSYVAAIAIGMVGCADDGGDSSDDTDNQGDGDKDSDMSPATSGKDEGMGDGSDVITIGDSWMSLGAGEGIQNSLEKVSGRDYRTYGVGGTRLLNEQIPMQYEAAKKENADIKTVVMTGGGNDILQDIAVHLQCVDSAFDNSDTCKKRVDEVAARLVTLWDEMSKDGVKDVIIIGYSNKAGIIGPLSKTSAYSSMKIPPLCEMVKAPLRCHAFDSDMAVPDLALRDGIHPNAKGYDDIATALWKSMQDWGVRR